VGSVPIGRIYGVKFQEGNGATVSFENNYAKDSMLVNNTAPSTPAHNNSHGANATLNDFRNINFWLDSDKLAFNLDGKGTGFGNIVEIWDFSTLASRGHPILVGLGGQ
jgi:hypothetical protein